jgi:hypothetical protein
MKIVENKTRLTRRVKDARWSSRLAVLHLSGGKVHVLIMAMKNKSFFFSAA